MKSLMEEASSIAKAIEKGWARAGKPKEFTVRIFEEPEKNFFGFTTKPAKVGILFKEPAPEQTSRMKEIKRLVEKREVERGAARAERAEKDRKIQSSPVYAESQAKEIRWTPEMIQGAKSWLDMVLRRADRSYVPYTLNAKNYVLTVQFTKPLFDDRRREQTFFRASSYLLLQALKNKFKKSFKGQKVIIIGQ